MQDAFGTLVWVVAIAGALVAIYTLVGTARSYRGVGGGGIGHDGDDDEDTPQERAEDIRQMLEARNERRARRGEAPVDVQAELTGLDAPPSAPEPPVSPALREEIRQHVLARNARRVRAGADPLDVDSEIERRIRDLT